jgi:hypothetical protein
MYHFYPRKKIQYFYYIWIYLSFSDHFSYIGINQAFRLGGTTISKNCKKYETNVVVSNFLFTIEPNIFPHGSDTADFLNIQSAGGIMWLTLKKLLGTIISMILLLRDGFLSD